jgi:hypothetical protein
MAGGTIGTHLTIPAKAGDVLVKYAQSFPVGGVFTATQVDPGNSGGTIQAVEIDASTVAAGCYVRFWFTNAEPIAAGEAVKLLLRGYSGKKVQYTFGSGVSYTNELWIAVCTTSITDNIPPDEDLAVNILLTPT